MTTTADKTKFPEEVADHNGVVTHISMMRVCKSNAGYFLGRTCWNEEYGGYESQYSRESGYFSSQEEAEEALKESTYEVRLAPENLHAYKNGLPIP